MAEMRWWFWWESFPFWGIQSSPGAILVISEAATATHHAVPAHLTLTLCYTVVLTVAPVVRHINEGAGTGPDHISAPLCVHKGHEAQVQSHPHCQTTPIFSAVTVAQHMARLSQHGGASRIFFIPDRGHQRLQSALQAAHRMSL